ncbi:MULTISPECIES: protein kinase [unclassified Massilia]|uniref:protein kinase domain-containing protein n=1 Tax=unclassified Massilia TaxID=2609279 RepID=UPI0017867AF8|nr:MULTISPECIES: protein kinase [unclassified Massilia]MBD8532356.1 protein kinase [Massilia sp. CFBP 13647]MBD8673771.1 protein kinase [Massilia sp. CFBP 13721]
MLHSGDIVTLGRGHYRLREQLAGSSYGLVWRAERDGFGPVALKLVNRAQMARAEPALRARWSECAAREIAFLSSLAPWDARHVVRLLDHGLHEGLPALALELHDGDLAAHLAARNAAGRRIGLVQALAWTGQVNAALATVHRHGWRYLDLKPANLLVDGGGSLRLADFGTNRSLHDSGAHSYAGTASWQAPEQFFPTLPDTPVGYVTDARADYFSLGALLYYLVTDGATLRYCSACGDAFRAYGSTNGCADATLRFTLPPILADDEAAHFLACADGDTGVAAALTLLRALLARRPQDRPPHALAISRLLAAAQGGPVRCAA